MVESQAANELTVADLYMVLGGLVVRAGHTEGALRRAVLWMADESPAITQRVARMGWSTLSKEVARRRRAGSDRADAISEVLTAHEFERLTKTRNAVVHGLVDVGQAPTILIAHYPSVGDPGVILADVSEYRVVVNELSALVLAIENAMPPAYRKVRWAE